MIFFRKLAKGSIGFALALTLVLAPFTKVQAAYTYTADDIMYLEGIELTAYQEGMSFGLLDMNLDEAPELFVGKRDGTSDILKIYVYDQVNQKAKLDTTIKKAVSIYDYPKKHGVIVETKHAPANTFSVYCFDKKGKLKLQTEYRAEIGGKYYKDKHEISKKKYKKFVKKAKKYYEQLVLVSCSSPWVDSSIIGVAETVGDRGLANDFRLSSAYSWLKEEHLDEKNTQSSYLNDVGVATEKNLKDMMTDSEKYTGANIEAARTYYDMIIDWEKRDQDGVAPLKEYIDRVLAVPDLKGYEDFITDPEGMYLTDFLSIKTDVYSHIDASKYIGVMDPGPFTMDPKIGTNPYVDDEGRKNARFYFETAVKYILTRAGYPASMIEDTLSKCFAFEDEIFRSFDYVEKAENIMSYAEVVSMCKNFPMEKKLQSYGITKGTFDVVYPKYVKALDRLYTAENLESLKAWLVAQTAAASVNFLDFEAAAQAQGYLDVDAADPSHVEWDETYTEEEIKEEMEKNAYYDAINGFTASATDSAYMEYFADPETKEDLSALTMEIKEGFRNILLHEDWLSDATKKKAEEKLDMMTFQILSADQIKDISYLTLDKEKSFFEAFAEAENRGLQAMRSNVGEPVDRTDWPYDQFPDLGTRWVNAFYQPDFNEFFICAGMVDELTYTTDMSIEEKLGRIGLIIGHELTHGFDPFGVQFDGNGNRVATEEKPYGWFEEEDYNNFLARVDKVNAYLDSIWPVPEAHCAGSVLSGEATADMGGIAIGLKLAESRDGFDYDKYFRTYAGFWQNQTTHQDEINTMSIDVHPLAYLRVNMTLQQFDEFLKQYDVHEGDGMYLAPEDRIRIW